MRALKLGLAFAACLFALSGWAAGNAASSYAAGQFYTTIDNPLPPEDPHKITVQEFFWYGCPHCFRLEPLLEKWITTLPKDVDFERVPDALGHSVGAIHQKAYYTEKVLGIVGKVHFPLFDAIHIKHERLNNQASLRSFFMATAGISATQFNNAWTGFTVDRDVRRADKLVAHDKIMAVPAIVVAGQYLLQNGMPGYQAMKNSAEPDHFHMMLKVANFLIEKVRKENPAQ